MLTQEIKEQFETSVYQIIEEHPNEKIHIKFELSVDSLYDVYGWDYEDELGKIFDKIYNNNQ